MKAGQVPAESIDAYIKGLPADAREILGKIRAAIRKLAPGSEERISYRMPAAFLNGRILIYFAAFKTHIGIFPPAKGDAAFMREIAPYAGPRGNLKFPIGKPMPHALMLKVIKAALAANLEMTREKKREKTTVEKRHSSRTGKR
jgi:uncharacterized protein YdhG (YjbR/CyaY superfamily)